MTFTVRGHQLDGRQQAFIYLFFVFCASSGCTSSEISVNTGSWCVEAMAPLVGSWMQWVLWLFIGGGGFTMIYFFDNGWLNKSCEFQTKKASQCAPQWLCCPSGLETTWHDACAGEEVKPSTGARLSVFIQFERKKHYQVVAAAAGGCMSEIEVKLASLKYIHILALSFMHGWWKPQLGDQCLSSLCVKKNTYLVLFHMVTVILLNRCYWMILFF